MSASLSPDRSDKRSHSEEASPDEDEQREEAIKEQTRPNAVIIHETIRIEGEKDLERTVSALLLSGLAAGLSMGFSLIAAGVLEAHLADTPHRALIASFGYPVGFLVVVLGRQQLFTENTLTPILPLLHNRDTRTLWRVARLWAIVLVANVAATWLISYACLHSGVFDEGTRAAFLDLSRPSIGGSFSTTFFKAVFAGWLIALMVWLLPAAEAARVPVILLLTYFVAAGGFSHIIAGSVDAAYLVHAGIASVGDYLGGFFLPTLCGNIVGGVTLVAMLNYGQVAPEI
jgi:formate/nitrite transporter FocA (FNT family)